MNPKLKELLDKYRSMDTIPAEALESIGLKKVKKWNDSGFTTKIVSINKDKPKEKIPPFETLEVKVKGGKVFHPISGERAYGLRDKAIIAHDYFSEGTDKRYYKKAGEEIVYPHISQAEEFINEIFSNSPHLIIPLELYYSSRVFPDLLNYSDFSNDHLGFMIKRLENGELTSDKVEDANNELEKGRAKLLDIDVLKKAYFNHIIKGDFSEFIREELISFGDKEGLDMEALSQLPQGLTMESLLLSHVPDYLQRQGYTKLAQQSKKSFSLEELTEVLSKATNHSLPSYGDYNSLSKRLKKATPGGRKSISKFYSEAKTKLKQERQFLENLLSFLMPYEIFSETSDSVLKPILDAIEQRGEIIDKTWQLDARPNRQIDLVDDPLDDLDCTRGPLPFNRPDTHKIKVYDGQKYIGKIYLLETKTNKNKQKPELVWHLDAIQIPRNLDWEMTLPNLVAALRSKAREKDISLITVNNELERISNFDYIGKAVANYSKAQYKNKRVELIIPEINDSRYSPFQYQSRARILWKKPGK
ncbi:hypothetical protein GOV12_00925 [Candidatus Pacearchaeota archaeon]|nr:hypothetical protein [Candidatus Pacearchaeota archaeon]